MKNYDHYFSLKKCFLFVVLVLSFVHSAHSQCDFTVSSNGPTYGCYVAREDVVSTGAVNVSITGNSITKNAGGNNWNAGSFSTAAVYNNGSVETVVSEVNTARVFGLSNTNPDATQNSILFGIYLRSNSNLEVIESGTSRGSFGAYNIGDTLSVRVLRNRILYYKNSALLYVSNLTPTFPLYADNSINTVGGTLQLVISNLSNGSFKATATTPGTGPIYQWKLNGANVGINSSTYSNTGLAVNDVLTCQITPGVGGCSVPPVTSNNLQIKLNLSHNYGDFYITSSPATSGCSQAEEQVVWDSLYKNVQVSGNSLTKIQSNSSWNGGVASINKVYNQGSFQFTTTESTAFKAIGLSTTDASSSYTTMQYGFYLTNIGVVVIYESNTNRGTFGAYTAGDVFKIAVESNVVKYYKNGVLLYISSVVPTLPLLADVSLYSVGAVVSNALISNYTTGNFTATATNIGASPIYQWKLNGGNVGTNSSTYSNSTLLAGDIVTCVLTPNLNGCAASTCTSNSITHKTGTPSSNIEFYIQGVTATTACNAAEEAVKWKVSDIVNLEGNGNSLSKIQGGNAWNGGAASWNTVKNNGYMQFTATETNTARMIGLSSVNADANFNTIQFAFYLLNNSTLRISEYGVNIGNFGSYLSNDVFKIAVESGVVKYYQNGVLLRISSLTPTLPLLADVSLNTVSATIANVVIGNYSTGTYSATALNSGVAPSYQWQLNGANVGANSATYTNATLLNGDVVTCFLTPNITGCSSSAYSSNAINNTTILNSQSIDFFVAGTAVVSACKEVQEEVVWVNSGLANVVATGNNIVKTQGGSSWNGGAHSWNIVFDNGYLQFTATEDDKRRVVGLSVNNADNGYNSIDYAFYLQNSGLLSIYELGVSRGAVSTYLPGDVFKIAIEGGVVKYYQNGLLQYISGLLPYAPLQVDVSIHDVGGTVTNAIIANYNGGSFDAFAYNAGFSPSYQWKLNGANVGANSSNYINASLSVNDQVSCVLTPNIPGCSAATYTSNLLTNKSVTTSSSIEFYIQGTASTSACSAAEEQVVWKPLDLLNVEAIGNNLTKIQSSGWNGGAASFNRVYNNGYVQFTATETNKARMIGLSANALDANYTSIQFAYYLNNIGGLQIYESGTNRGTVDSYFPGDILRIAVESSVVKYYKNNVLVYISGVVPTFPLLVDVSINTNGGTLSNVIVGNNNTGTFTATANNAGVSPTYQWKLNGVNVGTNSTTYTNTALAVNDVVTCILTPDVVACSSTYTSNSITNKANTTFKGGDFYIQGTATVAGCNFAEEAVKWKESDFNNVFVSGNLITKLQGGNNWNGGAASLNTVKNNGYAQFVVTETDRTRVFGLSTTNANSDKDLIPYAFYLRFDGSLRIYESNVDLGGVSAFFTNDVLRIAVENNVVKYYQNNTLVFISSVTPTLPLLVDISINGLGGTFSNVVIGNVNSGTFAATTTNVGGSPTYQWKLNGANVGTNSSTYANAALSDNDLVTCVLTPNLGGCATAAYTSNVITNKKRTVLGNVDFYIEAVGISACNNTVESQVKWKNSDLTNTVQVNADNSLLKLQSGGSWNGGASSWNSVADNGYLVFVAAENTTNKMIGLSTTSIDDNFTSIQYAFNLRNNGTLRISESGNNRGDFGAYNSGDILKIAVESNVVRYYNNGTLLYQSAVVPTLPLIVDVSMNSAGATFGNVNITNFNTTTFNATAINAGGSPSYQWKLNGVDVGSNSATYSNAGIVANDVVSCVMTTSVSGCGPVDYNSNTVTNKFSPSPATLEFYVSSAAEVTSCNYAEEEVRWDLTSLSNVQASLNNLFKTTSNGSWNGEAISRNTVSNNGYFQFSIAQTNRNRVVGLSNVATGLTQNTIQYAFYMRNSNNLDIIETGVSRGNFGTYAVNDVLKIAVDANVVKYYKNGTLIYTSAVVPTLPMFVDVCINGVGGTVNNAVIANYTAGNFTATALNAGPSPVYQWNLNTLNVGTNSSTYVNASLAVGDVVTCTLTPDIPGCPIADVDANNVTIKSTVTSGVIEFYVLGTPTTVACQRFEEQVRWKVSDLSKVQVNSNSLRKTSSNGNWDGGAASWNNVHNNGYFEFTATETDRHRIVGLSSTNVDANYTSIQYGIYIRDNNVVRILESGLDKGAFGAYVSGDVFRIAVESSVVKYYQNGALLYISTISPTLPLLVDVSIYHFGGTVTNAKVANYNTGDFTATATGAGVTPSYQWKLNGANVGTNSITYTNTNLNVNDVVSCVLTPDFGVCSVPVNSNTATSKAVVNPQGIDFYIKGTAAVTACNVGEEQVQWKISDLFNVQATSNSLIKVQSNGNWNGGASSWNTVSNDGYFQFTATENDKSRYVGLSSSNLGADNVTIEYAFYLVNNGTYQVRELGVNRGTFGTYGLNDVFKIAVEANVVKYYKNGSLVYISTVTPTLPMLVDVSINSIDGTVTNAIVANNNVGVFTATATGAGGSPTYQWKLNGANVGTNSTTYTNGLLNTNDVITCVLTPSLGGCSSTFFTSNTITNKTIANPTGIDFYIRGTVSSTACKTGEEQVKWKTSDLLNVQATANNLTKIQSNNIWNGGAASWNTVANNGYLQFTATEDNTSRMIGLSSSNLDADYISIQYAYYLVNNATYRIYESGTSRGTFGVYTSGDVFKIAIEANVVKYYKNGVLDYISMITPTLPLLVDVSIYTNGGTVTNAIVSNYNTGTFVATATGAGVSPAYQWKLNGGNVGSNSSTYTNTALNNNDVVACVLTPSLGGCSNVNYTSNSVTAKNVLNPIGIDFYIQGTPVTTACNTVNENVVWKVSDLLNVVATSNSLSKVQSDNNWNGGAASWNTVSNNGYVTFTTAEATTSKYVGLSTTNVDADNANIQFAFYLVNNGGLQVFESGLFRGAFGTYAPSDVLKIAVESSVVKYYKNGTLLYVSGVVPTLPLLVDVSIRNVGGTVNNVVVANYNTGGFTATSVNAGVAPLYQWKLNGVNVGTNSTTYTNAALIASDVVTCVLTPDLGGCSTTTYTSNTLINVPSISPSIQFYIEGSAAVAPSCIRPQSNVVWKNSDLLNVQATGNSLNKIQSNNTWDGGAASWNTVKDNGYFQFTATETNRARMVGLSSTNTDASNTTIQYAFYLTNTGVLQIFESGTNRGSFATFSTNDILRIEVESGVVKYYKNGSLVYTSLVAPTLPLLIDVSINAIGGTVTNAVVANLSAGTFVANPINAGGSPSYQWRLNGVNVGTNSNTYTNAALLQNDVVTCVLTPSIPGCNASSTISSNTITNKKATITTQPTNQTACVGSSTTFSVVVTGSDINYQWRKNGANIPGATSSSYTIATVTAGDAGSYDVLVTKFGCASNAVTLTLNNTNSWTGVTSTSWGTATNWSCGLIPTATTDVIIPSGVPNYPLNSGTANARDLTINPTAKLSNTGTLNIYGNFTGTGGTYTDDATTAFVGSSLQTVTDIDTLHSVNVDNAAGVTLATPTYVEGHLTLSTGALTSNGMLTVDLNVGAITGAGSGTIVGDITVLKWIWKESWHYISSPLSGRAVTEWNDDVLIKFGANTNLYNYDETIVSPFLTVGWTPVTTTAAIIEDMRGYALYFKRWQNRTTIDVTGPYDHAQTYTSPVLTNTISTDPLADGWNLMGNPYPCVIDWDAASGWTKTGLDDAIYLWDQSNNRFATYVAGIGTNGGSRYIPAMQGFYVKVSTSGGTGTLGMANGVRTTASNPDVWRIASEESILKLTATTGTYKDETYVRLSEDATSQFDGQLDAYKLANSGSTPSLSTKLNNVNYAVNSIPTSTIENVTIPVKLIPGVTGSYTVTADITGFEDAEYITLEDTVAKVSQDLKQNPTYTYDLVAGDTLTRLFINYRKREKIGTGTQDATSKSAISIYGQEQTINVLFDDQSSVANIIVYDVTGNVLYKAENKDVSSGKLTIKLAGVSSGVYIVKAQTDVTSKTQQVFLNK